MSKMQMTAKTPRDLERFAETVEALIRAGLSLEIQQSGDEAYIDIEEASARVSVDPPSYIGMFMQSKSDQNHSHNVVVSNYTGKATCPCDGFRWRSKCSHSRDAESLVRDYGIRVVRSE